MKFLNLVFCSLLVMAGLGYGGLAEADAAKNKKPKISFKLERSQPDVFERFEARYADNLELSLSSNAFCGPSQQVWLGEFKVPMQKSVNLDQRSLYQVFVRLPSILYKNTAVYRSPHSTRYFLNDRDVSQHSWAKKSISHALDTSCDTKLWQAQKAVRVEMTSRPDLLKLGRQSDSMMRQLGESRLELRYFQKGKQLRSQSKSYRDLNCRKVGRSLKTKQAVVECFVKNYGKALLLSPYLVL